MMNTVLTSSSYSVVIHLTSFCTIFCSFSHWNKQIRAYIVLHFISK